MHLEEEWRGGVCALYLDPTVDRNFELRFAEHAEQVGPVSPVSGLEIRDL